MPRGDLPADPAAVAIALRATLLRYWLLALVRGLGTEVNLFFCSLSPDFWVNLAISSDLIAWLFDILPSGDCEEPAIYCDLALKLVGEAVAAFLSKRCFYPFACLA